MKQTICLNMIVKNESRVIERCLKSVRPLIDHWVIVDTGSTDGTQQIIKKFLKGIPGTLYERPWVNFEHNRNEALRLAKGKGDYVLTLDADEELLFNGPQKLPPLDKQAYLTHVRLVDDIQFARILLIDHRINWFWHGVIHEQLHSNEGSTLAFLENTRLLSYKDGHRGCDPKKYLKDIEVLKKALAKEPDNSRYLFFLAQSYVGAGLYQEAIPIYQKRIEMKGWDEEVYHCFYAIGAIQQHLKMDPEIFINSFHAALTYRATRAEPHYMVAEHFLKQGKYEIVYLIAKEGLTYSYPKDTLLIDQKVYDYGFLWQMLIAASALGKLEESYAAARELLQRPIAPSDRPQILALIEKVHPTLLTSSPHRDTATAR